MVPAGNKAERLSNHKKDEVQRQSHLTAIP